MPRQPGSHPSVSVLSIAWLYLPLLVLGLMLGLATPAFAQAPLVEGEGLSSSLSRVLQPHPGACQIEGKDVLPLMLGLNLAYDFGLVAGALMAAIISRSLIWTALGALIGGTSSEILYLLYATMLEPC